MTGPRPRFPRQMRKPALLAMVLLLFGCDHATKIAAKQALANAPPVNVVQLQYVENRDVAFSMFRFFGMAEPSSHAVLLPIIALSTLAVAALWWWAWRVRREASLLVHAGFAMVFAGALGNLVDRAVRGYVVDFVHVRGWPIFNVADAAVVVGAVVLVIASRFANRARAVSSS